MKLSWCWANGTPMPFMYPSRNHTASAATSGHGPIEHQVLTVIKYASYAAAGLSLLPFVLQLGAEPGGAADMAMDWATGRCATPSSNTLAQHMAGFLAPIPLIGATLAAGGLGAVGIAAVIGIGGTLLGRYLEKKDVRYHGVNVGKVVRWAALATSMLCSMPAILSGISMGLHFLSSYLPMEFGDAFASGTGTVNSTLSGWANSIGSVGTVGAINNTSGAVGVALTHGVVCGLPALMSGKLSHTEIPKPQISVENIELGRIHDFRAGLPNFRAA